jgi:hypothetical protein
LDFRRLLPDDVPVSVQHLGISIGMVCCTCCILFAMDEGDAGRHFTVVLFLAALTMVPAIRSAGGVFFGCTYYASGRPNTYDVEPELSCYTWGWWLLYAVFAFMALLTLPVISHAVVMRIPAHPVYGYLFGAIKVTTTLCAVAFGDWHPKVVCGFNVMVHTIAFVICAFSWPMIGPAFLNILVLFGHMWNVRALPVNPNMSSPRLSEDTGH